MYSFVVSSPPMFGWGEFVQEGPGISCSVNWQSTSWNSLSYILFLFITGFFVQISVMLISYMCIYFAIHQITSIEDRRDRRRFTVAGKAESRVACMLTLMVICYLFAWLPYTVVSMAKVWEALLGNSDMLLNLNNVYGYLPALLAKSSITYNPVIYVLFNTQICRKGANYSSNQVNVGEPNKTGAGKNHQVTVQQTNIDLLSNPGSQSVTLQMDAVSTEKKIKSPTVQH
ncbi:parapinopsin-like [Daphnia pulicaria]|uniref:parapinopsin-like n=1 Tax=Daphnia pulicaria TaxID=35523 RepID=UPI001EEA1109|nr:parapinopsin-like [Daphnia pulicaria]